MDTKKLEALATAVQTGSFTRAAEVLGYTRPEEPLSLQIPLTLLPEKKLRDKGLHLCHR